MRLVLTADKAANPTRGSRPAGQSALVAGTVMKMWMSSPRHSKSDQIAYSSRQTTLTTYSYQRIAATGGFVSVSTESERSAGQGYPPTWQLRR